MTALGAGVASHTKRDWRADIVAIPEATAYGGIFAIRAGEHYGSRTMLELTHAFAVFLVSANKACSTWPGKLVKVVTHIAEQALAISERMGKVRSGEPGQLEGSLQVLGSLMIPRLVRDLELWQSRGDVLRSDVERRLDSVRAQLFFIRNLCARMNEVGSGDADIPVVPQEAWEYVKTPCVKSEMRQSELRVAVEDLVDSLDAWTVQIRTHRTVEVRVGELRNQLRWAKFSIGRIFIAAELCGYIEEAGLLLQVQARIPAVLLTPSGGPVDAAYEHEMKTAVRSLIVGLRGIPGVIAN